MQQSYGQESFNRLIVAIFRLSGQLIEAGDAIVKDLELTSARWQVLGALGAVETPLTVSTIARNMGLTRQSVQRTTDVLKDQGFVRYIDNPAHRRSQLVALTQRGAHVHKEAGDRQLQWINQRPLVLDSNDIARTYESLHQLSQQLEIAKQTIDSHKKGDE